MDCLRMGTEWLPGSEKRTAGREAVEAVEAGSVALGSEVLGEIISWIRGMLP